MTVESAALTAKQLVQTLAMMGLQASALAVVAYVLVTVARARRIAPAWQAAIWTVVLVKFVLPWGPAMPWSLSDIVASFTASPTTLDAVVAQAPLTAPVVVTTPSAAWLLLAAAWIAGSLYVLCRALIAHRGALAEARAATAAPADATAQLTPLAARMRVRRVTLVVGDAATGPFVVGLLRPIIVVPPALLADASLLRAALLHELAHVRRLDAIGRFVQLLATSVFFFWPIVRLAGRKLDLAREAACDAWALEATEVARPAYARLLVKMAALRTAAAPSLAMPRSLDARVAAVLGPPARARMGLVHWLAIAGWAAVSLGGARSADARGEVETCQYTSALASALMLAHPEADLDGDGLLSKDEACELQAEVRRVRHEGSDQVSVLSEAAQGELDRLLAEPLCCNCGSSDGMTPELEAAEVSDASCQRE